MSNQPFGNPWHGQSDPNPDPTQAPRANPPGKYSERARIAGEKRERLKKQADEDLKKILGDLKPLVEAQQALTTLDPTQPDAQEKLKNIPRAVHAVKRQKRGIPFGLKAAVALAILLACLALGLGGLALVTGGDEVTVDEVVGDVVATLTGVPSGSAVVPPTVTGAVTPEPTTDATETPTAAETSTETPTATDTPAMPELIVKIEAPDPLHVVFGEQRSFRASVQGVENAQAPTYTWTLTRSDNTSDAVARGEEATFSTSETLEPGHYTLKLSVTDEPRTQAADPVEFWVTRITWNATLTDTSTSLELSVEPADAPGGYTWQVTDKPQQTGARIEISRVDESQDLQVKLMQGDQPLQTLTFPRLADFRFVPVYTVEQNSDGTRSTSVNLKSSPPADPAYRFQWTVAGKLLPYKTSEVPVDIPAGTALVKLEYLLEADTAHVTVIQNVSAESPFQASFSVQVVEQKVTFKATSDGLGDSVTYQWDFDNSALNPHPTTPEYVVTYPDSGTYVVQLTATDTTTGNTAITQRKVTVPAVSIEDIPEGGQIDGGSSHTFSANLNGAEEMGGFQKVEWALLDGQGSVIPTDEGDMFSHDFGNEQANFTLRLTVTGMNGDTFMTERGLVVNPVPTTYIYNESDTLRGRLTLDEAGLGFSQVWGFDPGNSNAPCNNTDPQNTLSSDCSLYAVQPTISAENLTLTLTYRLDNQNAAIPNADLTITYVTGAQEMSVQIGGEGITAAKLQNANPLRTATAFVGTSVPTLYPLESFTSQAQTDGDGIVTIVLAFPAEFDYSDSAGTKLGEGLLQITRPDGMVDWLRVQPLSTDNPSIPNRRLDFRVDGSSGISGLMSAEQVRYAARDAWARGLHRLTGATYVWLPDTALTPAGTFPIFGADGTSTDQAVGGVWVAHVFSLNFAPPVTATPDASGITSTQEPTSPAEAGFCAAITCYPSPPDGWLTGSLNIENLQNPDNADAVASYRVYSLGTITAENGQVFHLVQLPGGFNPS